jgi:hypothetical protein
MRRAVRSSTQTLIAAAHCSQPQIAAIGHAHSVIRVYAPWISRVSVVIGDAERWRPMSAGMRRQSEEDLSVETAALDFPAAAAMVDGGFGIRR